MITSSGLRNRFGDLYDPVRLDLDADKNGIYDKDSGKRVASRMPWARYVFRSLENGRPNLKRVYKTCYYAADNESAMRELETLFKLQQAEVSGVPRIRRLGILERGGLWAELEGIENARSLDREIFGRVPRFFTVMIKAAEILQAIHAQGIIHGDVKPANILINDRQEIEWIDFEQGMFSEGYSALDENKEPIVDNQGKDTDAFSFIMTLASLMDDLLRGSAVGDAAKASFLKMRDGYLNLVFESFSGGVNYPRSMEPFKYLPQGFNQKPRRQWPQDMSILVDKLRSDKDAYTATLAQGRDA
jgi:hypothetical protein